MGQLFGRPAPATADDGTSAPASSPSPSPSPPPPRRIPNFALLSAAAADAVTAASDAALPLDNLGATSLVWRPAVARALEAAGVVVAAASAAATPAAAAPPEDDAPPPSAGRKRKRGGGGNAPSSAAAGSGSGVLPLPPCTYRRCSVDGARVAAGVGGEGAGADVGVDVDGSLCAAYLLASGLRLADGTRFGGDFLAYEEDPSRCHAAHVVRVLRRGSAAPTVTAMCGLARVAQTVRKTLLVVAVVRGGGGGGCVLPRLPRAGFGGEDRGDAAGLRRVAEALDRQGCTLEVLHLKYERGVC